jgi:predicted nucleotidyltransferase
MDRDAIIEILSQNREAISQFGVKSLALFGSLARNGGKPGSDVDILVEFEGKATFNAYMELKFFLEDVLRCGVDLVPRKALRSQLEPHVMEEALYVS